MKRKVICILFPIIICVITVIFLNNFLDRELKVLLETKNLEEINVAYGSIYKDKGLAYNDYLMKNNYLALQGSSEFVVPVSQLPTKVFPIKGMEKVFTSGRAYFQTLNHTGILGSENVENKEKKVTLLLSIQWFFDEGGADPKNFQANFSPVQFYKYLSNPKITEENKKIYASRVSNLLSGNSQFASEKAYAQMYDNDQFINKIGQVLFKPYFIFREKMVELKDKGLLYRRLKQLNPKKDVQAREVNWDEEYKKAEEEGKSRVTNNDFMVDDNYFTKYIKNPDAYKGSKKNVNLMKSKEFTDYELYLDTCVDLGIKPYIVLIANKWEMV